jgi:hypothetical protein
LDEDHSEVRREGMLVFTHGPPFLADLFVLLWFRALIVLPHLSLSMLFEFL